MTDQQREKNIASLSTLIEGAMARYEASGNFHDRGQADGYRITRDSLIRGRSAEQVASMQEALGLAA